MYFRHIETSHQSNGSIVSPNQQDIERARQLSVPSVSPVNVTPVNVPIRPMGVAAPVVSPNIPIPIQQPKLPKIEFETKEDAEAAYRELLKESVSLAENESSFNFLIFFLNLYFFFRVLKQIGLGNKP